MEILLALLVNVGMATAVWTFLAHLTPTTMEHSVSAPTPETSASLGNSSMEQSAFTPKTPAPKELNGTGPPVFPLENAQSDFILTVLPASLFLNSVSHQPAIIMENVLETVPMEPTSQVSTACLTLNAKTDKSGTQTSFSANALKELAGTATSA